MEVAFTAWQSFCCSNWLPIVKDIRTALDNDPLPLETVKELLGA